MGGGWPFDGGGGGGEVDGSDEVEVDDNQDIGWDSGGALEDGRVALMDIGHWMGAVAQSMRAGRPWKPQ